ncbi:MAG: hypothetical protein ACJAW8_001927 [Oleispira sp.]|jgi:hypothetical protein
MKLRFSRSTLNLIIFTCIILIGWASIDKNRTDDAPKTEMIELPPLTELQHQSWFSHEGIQVIWQTRLDTDFLIRIRGTGKYDISKIPLDSSLFSWQQGYWQWDFSLGDQFEQGLPSLSQQLNNFPDHLKGQPATIILQGPWSDDIARLTSARLIRSLALKPLDSVTRSADTPLSTKSHNKSDTNTYSCPWQPVSAQFWLQDQLTHAKKSQPNIETKEWIVSAWPTLAPINEASLRIWKQTFVQQWQLNWQNAATQFDILSDLAYYRLPQNYLLEGYWGINELEVPELETYLSQCQPLSALATDTDH